MHYENEEEEEESCEEDDDQNEDWWDEAEKEFEKEPSIFEKIIPKKKVSEIAQTSPQVRLPEPRGNALENFAYAIQQHEGWFPIGGNYPKGSASFRNNNPGNLKFVGQVGALGKDERGFAIFPNPDSGFRALQRDIVAKITRNPDWNFEDFFNVYAPSSDSNNPVEYARAVAKKLGVSSLTKISDVVS